MSDENQNVEFCDSADLVWPVDDKIYYATKNASLKTVRYVKITTKRDRIAQIQFICKLSRGSCWIIKKLFLRGEWCRRVLFN